MEESGTYIHPVSSSITAADQTHYSTSRCLPCRGTLTVTVIRHSGAHCAGARDNDHDEKREAAVGAHRGWLNM